MKKRIIKKDPGTIFNPVMYLMIICLTVILLCLFLEYRRVSWLSGRITNTMTDALLGAAVLNEEELYSYGRTNEVTILYPEEKYAIFQNILREELALDNNLHTTDNSISFMHGAVTIKDFVIYSVDQEDVTIFDFDETGHYVTTEQEDGKGILTARNGAVIEETTLLAEIGFTVNFAGVPIEVKKYHMVDVVND